MEPITFLRSDDECDAEDEATGEYLTGLSKKIISEACNQAKDEMIKEELKEVEVKKPEQPIDPPV